MPNFETGIIDYGDWAGWPENIYETTAALDYLVEQILNMSSSTISSWRTEMDLIEYNPPENAGPHIQELEEWELPLSYLDEVFFSSQESLFGLSWIKIEEYMSQIGNAPDTPDFDLDPVEPPIIEDPPSGSEVLVNEFTGTVPEMDITDSPEWIEKSPPGAPEITSPPEPGRPDFTFPNVPELAGIVLPQPLSLTLPTFEEALEDDDLALGSYTWNFYEIPYESDLLNAIKSLLVTEIQTGGYGLNQNDETLLWQRMREREDIASSIAIEEAKRNYSLTGFPVPPGSLFKAMERAVFENQAKNSSVNRDVSLKRADLYWEGKKFTVTNGIAFENMMVTLHNSKMERALNAAKAEVEIMIAYFNAKVARYNAKLARFKVIADVYETQIRAELAKVEIYKAQMEGARIEGEVQKNQVELYKAQVDGVKGLIEAYKADVETMNILMNVERAKMEIYRAEVEAYSAEVSAQKVRFDAYDSKIKGEVAKMQGYESEARAYAAYVEGKKAQVEIQRLDLQRYTEHMKAHIDKYTIEVQEKKDIRDTQKDVMNVDMGLYKTRIDKFQAQIQAASKGCDLAIASMDSAYKQAIAVVSANAEVAKLNMSRLIEVAKMESTIGIAVMDAQAKIITAEVSARNLNVSIGAHLSKSQAYQASWSDSRSHSQGHYESQSFNFNHNYNEEAD